MNRYLSIYRCMNNHHAAAAAMMAALSACAAIGEEPRADEAAAEAGEQGQVFGLATLAADGTPSTQMMFAPEGAGPEAWRALAGEIPLEPGTYRLTGRPDGETWVVEEAEKLASAQALGIDNPTSYNVFFDIDMPDAGRLHNLINGPVIDHLKGLGRGAANTRFDEFVINLPSDLFPAVVNDPCNFPLIVQQVVDGLREFIPVTYNTVFTNPRTFPLAIHPPRACSARLGNATIGPAPLVLPGLPSRAISVMMISPALAQPNDRRLYQSVLAKLYGFNYGLRLANRFECGGDGFFGGSRDDCDSITSSDPLVIMGGVLPPYEPFFDFSQVHKAELGWLQRSATVNPLADQGGFFKIGASTVANFPGDVLHEIRVPISGSRYYSISYQPPPQPASGAAGNTGAGVSVRVGGQLAADGTSHLVNMHPEDSSGLNAALDCSGGQRQGGIFADDLGFFIAMNCQNEQPVIAGGVASVVIGKYRPATVVNAADFDPAKPITPGQMVSIFGDGLSGETAVSAEPVPLLGGTSVTVIDEAGNRTQLGLTYVSPTQINGETKVQVQPGRVRMITSNRSLPPAAGEATVSNFSPAFFTDGADGTGPAQGYVVRVKPDGSQPTELLPSIDLAPPDDRVFIALYGTGFRGVADRTKVLCTLTVTRPGPNIVRGEGVVPSFIGAADHVGPGVDQVNIEVPRSLADGAGSPGTGTVSCTGESRTSNSPILTYR
jgi:uncharacterized protein (TIGR03437 family)